MHWLEGWGIDRDCDNLHDFVNPSTLWALKVPQAIQCVCSLFTWTVWSAV